MTRMTAMLKRLMIGSLTVGLSVTTHTAFAKNVDSEHGAVDPLNSVAVVPLKQQTLVRRGLVRGHRDFTTADARSPGAVATPIVRRGVNRTALVPSSQSTVISCSMRRGTRNPETRSEVLAKVS